jgi:hypothetical protein
MKLETEEDFDVAMDPSDIRIPSLFSHTYKV